MSKLPWEKNRDEITAEDWVIACNIHPKIRDTARHLRVCSAVRHFLYKDTPYAWPSQETLRQHAHVADRSQLHKSLVSIREYGAFDVLPIAEIPDSVPAKRRDARGVFYRINFQWAFETLRNHFGQHQQEPAAAKAGRDARRAAAKPPAPSNQENYVSPGETYPGPEYVSHRETNYVSPGETLTSKGTLREETPSCGSPAFAFGGSASAPLGSPSLSREIPYPGLAFIGGNRKPDDDLRLEEDVVVPSVYDILKMEEDEAKHWLHNLDYVRMAVLPQLPDRRSIPEVLKSAALKDLTPLKLERYFQ